MSELAKPNCYCCKHSMVCSFRQDIDKVLQEHLGWVNVDMRPTPDWQRLFETLAKACLNYDFTLER